MELSQTVFLFFFVLEKGMTDRVPVKGTVIVDS